MANECPWGWKVCYENEPCYLCLKSQRDDALRQLHQLQQRVSPATEPCGCPEFCPYHARSNFESMRPVVEAAKELIGLNVTRPDVYKESDQRKYRLALTLQRLTKEKP